MKFKLISIFIISVLFLGIYSRSVVAGEIINGINEKPDLLLSKGIQGTSGTFNLLSNDENKTTIYVDKNNGENHYNDLQTAVNKSKAGDVICVEPGFYKGNGNSNIVIDHNLTITGNSTNRIGIDVDNTKNKRYSNNTYFSSDVVFDGEKRNSFFTIENNINLNLINLTFVNGVSQSSGGAITNKGILSLYSSSFSNNSVNINFSSNDWWDAPHDTKEELKNLSDSSKSFGGAIYSNNQLYAINSNFENNSAGEYCGGGAIFNDGKIEINNSLFKRNNAFDGGGAIFNENGELSIDHSTFELNNASTDRGLGGGAIYTENTNIKIESSIFGFNIASKSYGGAINNKDSSLTCNNNYFIYNVADGGDGGAIYSLRNYETLINASLFLMNNASADGGAIYHKASKSYNIQNSALINNTANRGGGTYFAESEEIKVSGNSFLNNSVDSEGGAIYNTKTNINLSNNEISANHAKVAGALYSNSGSLNISDSILRDNKASSDGGALYSSTNRMNIKNDTLINNTAENNGGAFYLTGISDIVDNSTFAVNDVLKNGGTIYSTESVNVHDSNFKGNMAVEDGGVIWTGKTPSLIGNLYEKNMAGKYGGVLFSKQDKPSENSCSLNENGAGYGGDNYYTQKQKNNAPAIFIGMLVSFIAILIGLIAASIITAGALTPTVGGWIIGGFGPLTLGQTIIASVIAGLAVGLASMGLVFLTEYLFELNPEFKKFNERNPLVIPLISLALVLCGVLFVVGEAIHASGGIIAALGKGGIILIQHIDDLVTTIIFGVKAGASSGSGNDNIKPPDLSGYQNNPPANSSNQPLFFKGISFKYNGVDINFTDYIVSDFNMASYNNEPGLCDFNFQANPKIPGYPKLYCKGSYNSMNYHATIDFFPLVDYDFSSRVYSWEGHYSDLFNIM